MPSLFNAFTDSDIAKYPFLKETSQKVQQQDLRIASLANDDMAEIVALAEERVITAINFVRTKEKIEKIGNLNSEIFSFPIALLLVSATENSFVRKRYALAEAKQATLNLTSEKSLEKIKRISENFDWKTILNQRANPELPYEYALSLADYLRNTSHLHDKNWKLINRILYDGYVYLHKPDFIRLLEEEIKRNIEARLGGAEPPELPEKLVPVIERIQKIATDVLGTMEDESFPKVVVQEAFPPCINALYDEASKNHHLSHMGRFTLTSFLVYIGMSPEQLNELYKSFFSDYNERLTRYQIEHIAGERGSGTKYTPPQCSVLQTHGLCKNPDELCRRAYHPLKYYRRKQAKALAKQATVSK
ncbi:MAG: DNA primase large subunit PriL [Candidatus Bathyarchaeota archaeon]|nr:DNA primase large subunit PriL [Candidatus Bathyarchaeota archaeon]